MDDVDATASEAPDSSGPVSFEEDIRPMFRAKDRDSMQFAFDLWSYDDVAAHADSILQRLDSGTMPCDGPWPAARRETFRRWIEAGSPA